MANEELLEPLLYYQRELEEKFRVNTETYLDELVKQSGINVEENRRTVKEYREVSANANKANGKVSSSKALKVFLTVVMVVAWVVFAVALITMFVGFSDAKLLTALISLGIAVGMIVLKKKKVNAMIAEREKRLAELRAEEQRLYGEASAQMAPLNALFDWGIPAKLIRKTTPLIAADDNFDVRKLQYLNEKYGFSDQTDNNVSTLCLFSGSIVGNPFLVREQLSYRIVDKVYTGTLTISWMEHYYSDGKRKSRMRTQTLTASVVKPAPEYARNTELVYGNDAAPDLSFSREPSGINGMSEGQIERKIKKDGNRLERIERKAVESGESFSKLSNSEFESLFGATDRDNELQFRLLFTPLAQKNMVALLRTQKPFGDDFYMKKSHCLNYIRSGHAQKQDLSTDPSRYCSYDYDECARVFNEFNNAYFCSVYFDLAPVLSIPLYQQQKPKEYIYGEGYYRNYTGSEAEVLANAFPRTELAHPDAHTESILKTDFLGKDGNSDKVKVTAHAFTTIEQIDYIPVHGQDGHIHNVPVPWTEFIPVEQETVMEMRKADETKQQFESRMKNTAFSSVLGKYTDGSSVVYQRGLMAFLNATGYTSADDQLVSQYFKNT